ncbi:hypothetical protein ACFT0G_31170 [Streptomyces sp. NPDC057020]|uniref:hypothetical protein n=1 Tax=unclassified Streptomyces TaxID=2593676 RepID=UPI00362D8262
MQGASQLGAQQTEHVYPYLVEHFDEYADNQLSRAAIAMNGLLDHDLPTLACAAGVDSAAAQLVSPPA